METLVIPNIENVYRRERARDELPQSGSGRTIMTAEPKFVPEEAVAVTMEGGAAFQVRLIDCVGYMVEGAVGHLEGETQRMVTTPWFDHEIPMSEAAEIVRQGGRYGVRLKASAPSIHMIRADIETEVAPIVGTEKQSEEMVHYLLQEFEGDTSKIWQSNIFGKSFYELVGEDLNTKVKRMPEDAREKLRETLQRIINEGSGGLICIIL